MAAQDHIAQGKLTGLSRRKFVTAAAAGAGWQSCPGTFSVADSLRQAICSTSPVSGWEEWAEAIFSSLASQNIVALCDVDWDYAGRAFDRLDADLERQQSRLKEAKTDESTPADLRADRRDPKDERADAEGEALSRLSRDARTAKGYRCGRDRNAGPHARHHRDGCDGSEQARLCPEAADLVGP